MDINLNLIETVLFTSLILITGYFINKKLLFLQTYNIPEPVVGGIVFSSIITILYTQFNISINFDQTLKYPFMLTFFATVGLSIRFKLLIKGGGKVFLFLVIASAYVIFQDGLGIILAKITDMHPLCGLLTGSITLTGGHATGVVYAGIFSKVYNIKGAMELAMASATFGLILGGIIGGPVANKLIKNYNLKPENNSKKKLTHTIANEVNGRVDPKHMIETILIITFCITMGRLIYKFCQNFHIPLPSFIWTLLVGIIVTNVCDITKIYKMDNKCVELWGSMGLSMFLAMSLISLKLWYLMNLATPIFLIITAQTLFIIIYSYFVTFRVMGKDYDAAIIAAGHCGFALGSTPTAIANMEAIVDNHGPSPHAFLIVPIVSSFFIDIANTSVLQTYFAMPFVK